MTETTLLDEAHAQMEVSDAARLQFFATLADTVLFVLLEGEPDGDQITPQIFPVEETQVVLGFDREDRLAEFSEGESAYAAIPGRVLAQMLAPEGLGLGLNLDVAPSAMILPPDALQWLCDTLGQGDQDELGVHITELQPPMGVPSALMSGLAERLTRAAGLADCAYLALALHSDGSQSHVLAVIGAQDGAQAALTGTIHEALKFSGIDAGYLDVTFLDYGAAAEAQFARVGHKLDIPEPVISDLAGRSAPGMDPDKPPKLR